MMNQDNNNNTEKTNLAFNEKRVFRRQGDIREQGKDKQIWLISFTDVMALMLTFFVLLFSMTEPTKQDWSEVTAAMKAEFNKFYGAMQRRGPQDAININKIDFDRALNIDYLAALLESVISDNELLSNANLIPQGDRLIISLPRDILFDPGQAEVREQGSKALYALGGALSKITNKLEIIGHADPRPIDASASQFNSNWDLSMLRALNVSAILEKVGYQNDITIRGLSNGRYQDLESIKDEQRRLELARRVDIVILNHDGSRNRVFFDPADP